MWYSWLKYCHFTICHERTVKMICQKNSVKVTFQWRTPSCCDLSRENTVKVVFQERTLSRWPIKREHSQVRTLDLSRWSVKREQSQGDLSWEITVKVTCHNEQSRNNSRSVKVMSRENTSVKRDLCQGDLSR